MRGSLKGEVSRARCLADLGLIMGGGCVHPPGQNENEIRLVRCDSRLKLKGRRVGMYVIYVNKTSSYVSRYLRGPEATWYRCM